MPNRQLSHDELEDLFYPLLERTRNELRILSEGDEDLERPMRPMLGATAPARLFMECLRCDVSQVYPERIRDAWR